MSVSILVLTLNEQNNLPECLGSVAWADDIVVLDSFSTDDTVHIAEAYGARVVQRRFENWSTHQNWALDNIEFKHRWVFYIDADERMTDLLRDEILAVADRDDDINAYYCSRQNFFMGCWIKHAMPPGHLMRFFRPGHLRFERLVNPTAVVAGQHGYLVNHLVHYNFSKGLTEWFEKHNKYSHFEALEGYRVVSSEPLPLSGLTAKDKVARRRSLKSLAFRLPARPALKFIYLYILKGGWLDGKPGLTYCLLQSIYEYMIVLKMLELRRREAGLSM